MIKLTDSCGSPAEVEVLVAAVRTHRIAVVGEHHSSAQEEDSCAAVLDPGSRTYWRWC